MTEKEIAVPCPCAPPYLTLRIRRKTNSCLNCGHTLGEIYNFCPHCGQENNDKNVSFGTFVGDFFSNYFSFDTRIGRSIKPLFLRPGFLTNRFNEGQRKLYVHPLRIYLIVSLLFFFLVSLNTKVETGTGDFGKGLSEGFLGIDTDSPDKDSVTLYKHILLDESLSDKQVLDSLAKVGVTFSSSSWVVERMVRQGRKLFQIGPAPFVDTFTSKPTHCTAYRNAYFCPAT